MSALKFLTNCYCSQALNPMDSVALPHHCPILTNNYNSVLIIRINYLIKYYMEQKITYEHTHTSKYKRPDAEALKKRLGILLLQRLVPQQCSIPPIVVNQTAKLVACVVRFVYNWQFI